MNRVSMLKDNFFQPVRAVSLHPLLPVYTKCSESERTMGMWETTDRISMKFGTGMSVLRFVKGI